MKTIRWSLVAAACLALAVFTPAQSVDAFFGFNTLMTSAANGYPKLGGGLYPNAGGDIIFLPFNLGVGAQVAWRGSATNYFGQPLRPVFYDFNLVWEPVKPGAKVRPDFNIGFGAENLRFYTGYTCGTFSCTNHVSSNHLILTAAVGVKVYITDHIFLRPAVDYYNIKNNLEYGVPSAWQAGISIGYTLGPSS